MFIVQLACSIRVFNVHIANALVLVHYCIYDCLLCVCWRYFLSLPVSFGLFQLMHLFTFHLFGCICWISNWKDLNFKKFKKSNYFPGRKNNARNYFYDMKTGLIYLIICVCQHKIVCFKTVCHTKFYKSFYMLNLHCSMAVF